MPGHAKKLINACTGGINALHRGKRMGICASKDAVLPGADAQAETKEAGPGGAKQGATVTGLVAQDQGVSSTRERNLILFV